MAALVIVLHVLAVIVLVRAFAPQFVADVARTVTQTFDMPLEPPHRPETTSKAGTAGASGKRATPRDAALPKAAVPVLPIEAPPVVGTGRDNAVGASPSGLGLGAGKEGSGTGGGGIAVQPVKIAGDINSARDFPRASHDLRLGHQVVVILRVGTDGTVTSCRVSQPSPDAEADRITCHLAAERFRFRPARDAAGNPVEADYGWRQRWFLAGQSDGD
ncbi:protein TonB [Novosphingobium sp. PhB165]|nr:protein TonB [Novosphingobium sp. PhB165]